MNLNALWNYMQYDLEADKFRSEMNQSPKRKLLLKHTEFLKEQQARFAKSEADINAIGEKLEELSAEIERLSALIQETIATLTSADANNGDDIAAKLKIADKQVATLESYEKELNRLRKEAESTERNQIQIKRNAAKAKGEYDAVKAEYDKEFATDKVKLKQLKDTAEKEAAKLAPEDLERYKQIKAHCTPPISKVVNNQCTGCFMTLSVGTLRDIKDSGKVIACDNCGRLLYTED